MRKFVLCALVVLAFFLVACKTTETIAEESPPVKEVSKPNPSVQQIVETPAVSQEEKEPAKELETVKQPEPEPEPEPNPAPVEEALVNEEYLRSISGMESGEVSRKDFEDDKRKILEIIDELADVMSSYNYDDWLSYIEPNSVKYWQDAKNLANASQRLPVSVRAQLPSKRLKTLRDYFSFVFVPARKDRVVDEIRYISPESVKAVDVTADSDIIYYNFKKLDGKWFIHLPASDN